MTLKEVAKILDGVLIGEDVEFDSLSFPTLATETNLSFIKNSEPLSIIKKNRCKNFIVSNRLFLPKDKNYIVVKTEPFLSLPKLLQEMKKKIYITNDSIFAKSASISKNSYIGSNVFIGENSIVEDNVKIYDNVNIGNNVKICSGAIIGKPGFSHYRYDEEIITLNGIGGVIIEDKVEIGCNSCIDSGVFSNTKIGKNTKIDNFCQIGHDVEIGEGSILCSQVGIAGYTKIGKNSLLYGKVGIGDSLTLGDNFIAKGFSAVTKPFPPKTTVSGIPARENRENLKKISKKLKKEE